MNQAEFDRAATAFAVFHQVFAPLFGRKEAQRRSEQYIRGLLVQQTDRRNAENIAEAVDGATPRTLQRLLTEAPWETAPVIDALQAYLAPRLNTPDGVFVLDESGFPKKGTKSVGVARQYCGALGKVGNCQLGVFLAYVSARGHALIDTRLVLPQEWTDAPARCRAAGVPDAIVYQSKAELGLAMLEQARTADHLTGRWVTGDEDYGKVPSLRDALDTDGWWYVLEVPATTPVFAQSAETAVPAWSGRGRKPVRARLVVGTAEPETVATVAGTMPSDRWQVLTVAEGAQGPRTYQFVAQRVWESRGGLPGRACWLVLRRNLDGSELKFYLSNASADTPLLILGRVGAARWPIETEFQTEKGETGLDEYEVRSWAGWHHHMILALVAGAFLLTIQQDWGGKSARSDAAPSQSRAARDPTAADLDAHRLAGLARRHATTQRPRQTLTHQTSPSSSA
jgi:SRSO17 transposase